MNNKSKMLLTPLAQAVVTSLLGVMVAQSNSHAAGVTVNTIAESGTMDCTLRQAISSINNGADIGGCKLIGTLGADDIISFSNDIAGETIKLESGTLQISSPTGVIIKGSGVTIDGDKASRIFSVEENSSLIASELKIIGGLAAGSGGGILVTNANLELSNCLISGNSANRGGGVYARGSTVSITDSSVSDNSSTRGAGGIRLFGNSSSLNRVTIDNNKGQYAGGLSVNSFSNARSSFSLTSSTISNNSASNEAGGISVGPGTDGDILNTTFSGNSADTNSGAIEIRGGVVTIINSTISDNRSPIGSSTGALSIQQGDSSGTLFNSSVTFRNSILANTVGGAECYIDGNSTLVTGGESIIEDGSCSSKVRAVDPMLTLLTGNGGPTLTHNLKFQSPARGTANIAYCPPKDQRGRLREIDDFFIPIVAANQNVAVISLSDSCDVGSIEGVVEKK